MQLGHRKHRPVCGSCLPEEHLQLDLPRLSTDIGYSFDLQETAGDPWNSPDKMWVCSPLKYAHKAKTPTLFIQSDEDYRCYMGDALQMFSALKYFRRRDPDVPVPWGKP